MDLITVVFWYIGSIIILLIIAMIIALKLFLDS
nr:MAG TPA: Membrane fusion protein Use1 [Caudoviricetes sp.]